jgi:hypothetical protein
MIKDPVLGFSLAASGVGDNVMEDTIFLREKSKIEKRLASIEINRKTRPIGKFARNHHNQSINARAVAEESWPFTAQLPG